MKDPRELMDKMKCLLVNRFTIHGVLPSLFLKDNLSRGATDFREGVSGVLRGSMMLRQE